MYILWYASDEKQYKLQLVSNEDTSALNDERDIVYEFDSKESSVAEKVLNNLNLALRNVA